MCGVTGIAPATKALQGKMNTPAKAISNVLTADWFWAMCIVIGAILVPAPAPGATTVLGLPKLCIFRNITGIACPGCGMTRSLIASGHLHLHDALTFHPLGPPVLLLLIIYLMVSILRLLSGRTVPIAHRQIPNVFPILLTLTFTIVWLIRLLGFLPTPA